MDSALCMCGRQGSNVEPGSGPLPSVRQKPCLALATYTRQVVVHFPRVKLGAQKYKTNKGGLQLNTTAILADNFLGNFKRRSKACMHSSNGSSRCASAHAPIASTALFQKAVHKHGPTVNCQHLVRGYGSWLV
ncbi:unnamed protein product [Ixodes persulcatus]